MVENSDIHQNFEGKRLPILYNSLPYVLLWGEDACVCRESIKTERARGGCQWCASDFFLQNKRKLKRLLHSCKPAETTE